MLKFFSHPKTQLAALAIWASMLPFWNLGMSVAMFFLLLVSVVAAIQKKKFLLLPVLRNPIYLCFLLVWTLLLFGFFRGGENALVFKEIKTLLPLVLAPLFLQNLSPLSKQDENLIWKVFFFSVGVAALICVAYAVVKYPLQEPRAASLFVSHIRFSLMAVLALFAAWGGPYPLPSYLKIALTLVVCSFFFFVGTLTGWGFLIVLVILLFASKSRRNKFIVVGTSLALTSILLFFLSQFAESNSFQTENGNRVFVNIAPLELDSAWLARTNHPMLQKDARGQLVQSTLIRYLASKGLTKDAAGVQQLSDSDISNILTGYTNCNEPHWNALEKRWHQIVFEYQSFRSGENPSGHSIFQRLEYYKAARYIIQRNVFFGVGQGNVKSTYTETYKETSPVLDEKVQHAVHNQFLSYWIAAGVAAIISFLLYFYFMWKQARNNEIALAFVLLAFLSCLTEDTLTTQPGVAFFAFFSTFFFFLPREED
ncbi:MAG: O-antigen ligase family protein [Sediminibacterium sp.]